MNERLGASRFAHRDDAVAGTDGWYEPKANRKQLRWPDGPGVEADFSEYFDELF